MQNTLLFTYRTNIFVRLNLPISKELLTRIFLLQNPENVRPYSNNSIENAILS